MDTEKFIELFQETLEIEDREVKLDDVFRDYEEWDSLAVLAVLAMIKEEYNIAVQRDEFNKLTYVKDIFNYVNNK